MKKINCLLSAVFLLMTVTSYAQTKYSISGTVRDDKSGEEMIGAILRIAELPSIGISTNSYGFYSLTLPEGDYTLVASSLGFADKIEKITLHQNLKLDIRLGEETATIEEVTISATKADNNVTQAQMGVEKLDIQEIAKIPVLFGEKDILKTLQLLPGIKSAGEGNSGFNVRGGATDQNLILLDEAPVYNASHLLGFFSTFNSDAIKDVAVYKGGMPSQFGGRLSSVLDIKMKEGNDQHYGVSGGIGLIASRLNIEGPIVKDKGSFLVSARRTYADVFLKLSSNEDLKNSQLYFYDINAKANYRINDKNRIFLSGYFGRDKLGVNDVFGIDWGNATGTARWNHIINSKWFSNTSAIYSNYSYKIAITSGTTDFDITSRIRDVNAKQEFQFFPNPNHNFRFGVNSIYHTIVPGQINAAEGSGINSLKLQDRYAWENALYASDDWKVNDHFNINYGLRLSSFSALGSGNFYSYNAAGDVTDTTRYSSGQFVKTYFNLEPRLSMSYVLNSASSLKAGYARNTQYLHLISNSTSTTPTDLWIPSSANTKPEISDQVSVGYYRNFFDNALEFSVETYYKTMQNQIDYRNGANTQGNDKIEGELLTGKGRAYGIEFLLKKKTGRFTGWIGYTLSRTERKIDGINDNNWYVARQDRTHDVSVVGIFDLTKRWSLSATWVYSTGNAVTFPSGKYFIDGQVEYLYTSRNGYRMPAYHRLDLGATWTKKRSDRRESSWSFSLYNAYGRENAYTIDFRQSETDPTKTEAVQTSLFRWIPSVSYNFKF